MRFIRQQNIKTLLQVGNDQSEKNLPEIFNIKKFTLYLDGDFGPYITTDSDTEHVVESDNYITFLFKDKKTVKAIKWNSIVGYDFELINNL